MTACTAVPETKQLSFLHHSCTLEINNMKQTFKRTTTELITKQTNNLSKRFSKKEIKQQTKI